MTSRISRKYAAVVGPIMAKALARRIDNPKSQAKQLGYEIGVSDDTGARMLHGDIGHGENLLAGFARYGWDYIRELLEPIAGEMPTAAELAEVEAMRRLLDVEVVPVSVLVSSPVAVASGAGAAPSGQGARDRDAEGLVAPGLVVTRRSLSDIAGRKSHLATHLRRWSESLGLAERSSLRTMGEKSPEHRTSITTKQGDDLLFNYISPAFRLHAVDRDKLIGLPLTASFDRSYAEACRANTLSVLASGKPAVDDVDATVAVEPGVSLRLTYRRLILPYLEGRTPFAVCASEPIAGTA